MKREELEALSTDELRKLISDANAVLTSRGAGPSSLFSFGGSASSGGQADSGSSSIFGPPARTAEGASGPFNFGGGQPASAGSANVGKLFGGTGGGLFGGASATAAPTSGAGKLFGGSGGGLFGGAVAQAAGGAAPAASAIAQASAEADEADGDDDGFLNEEEVTAVFGWAPSITLQVLDHVDNGEEGEEELYAQRSKLFRFRDTEWKERGLGEAKLLKDKATGRVRFLLRQEKTGKVVANHYVIEHAPYCDLRPNADSEKIWVWSAQDWSDGELEVERFALKFGTVELAAKFKEAFNDAKAQNAEVLKAS